MKRAFLAWMARYRQRRAALRRAGRGRRFAYQLPPQLSTLGTTRFGRFEARLPRRQWLRRSAAAVLMVAAGWVLWQSWIGLGIFNH